MDLRTYLEQDMADFLEERLSVDHLREQSTKQSAPRYEDSAGLFTKDYEADLFSALKRHDVTEAKRVLHAVKDDLEQHPVGSPERRQLEAILRSLYDKFKQYLETETTLSKFEKEIDHLDDQEGAPLEEAMESYEQNEEHPHEESERLKALLDRITLAIGQHEASEARELYQEAKRIYQGLPSSEQRAYRNDLLDHHRSIAEMLETHSGDGSIESAEERLERALADGDLHEAMAHYEELRDMILELPREERRRHLGRARGYYDRIVAEWRRAHPGHDASQALDQHERRLSGQP